MHIYLLSVKVLISPLLDQQSNAADSDVDNRNLALHFSLTELISGTWPSCQISLKVSPHTASTALPAKNRIKRDHLGELKAVTRLLWMNLVLQPGVNGRPKKDQGGHLHQMCWLQPIMSTCMILT